VAFRHHGILSTGGQQVSAFYRTPDSLCVVRRDLADDSVESFSIAGAYTLTDAHNSISLGMDRRRHLHISYDHHGSSLHYRRTRTPFGIRDWTDELPMSGAHERHITYPTFLMPPAPGPLLMLYRTGTHNRGVSRLKRYDEDKAAWEDGDSPITSGADQQPWTSNAYWNHPAIGPDGRIHLSFVWRTDPIGPEARVNNVNVDYAVSADYGASWQSSLGRDLRLPITQVNSETILAVSPGSNLINQCGMTTDSRGRPHLAFYSDDPDGIPQYRHLWFDGRRWRHNVISRRTEGFALAGAGTLDIPISRPDIVVDRRDRAYVIYRGDLTGDRLVCQRLLPPDYDPDPADVRVLWDADLGSMEPVVDRCAWRDREILSMLIQRNLQPHGDGAAESVFEPVHLCDWNPAWDW